jgi:hypothetical protein
LGTPAAVAIFAPALLEAIRVLRQSVELVLDQRPFNSRVIGQFFENHQTVFKSNSCSSTLSMATARLPRIDFAPAPYLS